MKFFQSLFKMISSKQITQTLLNLLIMFLILLLLDSTRSVWGGILRTVWLVIKPFFLAFVIAFVLNPFINWVQKYVKKRSLAVGLVYIACIACIILLISLAIPLIYTSLTEMYPAFESGLRYIARFIATNFNYNITSLTTHIQLTASQMLQSSTVLDTTLDVLNQALINITNILIYLILAIYMSINYQNIRTKIKLLSRKIDPSIPVYLKEINLSLIQYVKAFAIGALAQALTTSIMYLAIGHHNWLLLGVFSGISSIIPYVGPICANILGVITSLSMGTSKLIILFIFIFIQSNIMSYVIQPKIYSSQIDLSIMWVLFGILSGSTLFGMWGMVIAMPLLVTIKITYRVYRQHNPL